MTDPAVFLAARLDAVEATARAAEAVAKSPWSVAENSCTDERDTVMAASPLKVSLAHPARELWLAEGLDAVYGSEAVAAHVAMWDPATVLRMVAASRAMLELHANPGDYGICRTCNPEGACDLVEWPCPTIKALANGWGWIEMTSDLDGAEQLCRYCDFPLAEGADICEECAWDIHSQLDGLDSADD